MLLMYYLNDEGKRVYTLKRKLDDGTICESAHPARFSPDDKMSKFRVATKKRYKMLLHQQPQPVL
eukprot:snap_masked-scaffold_72-processed-gene-0.33-mRNA-1 protein AED:0.31 eAED:0.31 QI:0/-1/0/1/-1/1/1/0/64